jgi:hypothetical protein
VIVLHEPEGPLDHGVLKASWAIHGRDFAREALPHAKMLRAPRNTLPQPDEPGSYAGGSYSGLSRVNVSGEMHFDIARKVEASLDWGVDDC